MDPWSRNSDRLHAWRCIGPHHVLLRRLSLPVLKGSGFHLFWSDMTGEPADTPARTWRERAVECRREAAANRNPGSVAAWLRLAQRYDELAECAETEAAALAAARSQREA